MKQKAIQTVLLAGSMLAYVMLPCISQAEVVQNTAQTTSSTVNTPQQTTIPSTATIRYFYDGSTLVNAEDDNGDMSTYLDGTVRSIVNVNSQTVLDTQCLFTDGKNVIAQTDSTGTTVTSTQQYNAYGQPVNYNSGADSQIPKSTNQPLNISTNPFAYDGYYYDSESGLYYLNARYYSPTLMQFISMDSYDLANRSVYCDGNPIGGEDPTGHSIVQMITNIDALGFMLMAAALSGGTAIAAYMGSNAIYSAGQIAGDAAKKNWTGIIGNMFFLAAGLIGASGAIPKAFAQLDDNNFFINRLRIFNNRENAAIPDRNIRVGDVDYDAGEKGPQPPPDYPFRLRLKWVQNRTKTPSTITGVLGGIGAGIANAPHTNNQDYNIEMGAIYAGVSGVAGFASGWVYGKFNMTTPLQNAPGRFVGNALIKSGFSGAIGGFAAAGEQINNAEGRDGTHSSLILPMIGDFASPFALATLSGLTQNYSQFGTGTLGKIANYARYAYLDAKTNYTGQLFSIGLTGIGSNVNPKNGIV